MFIAVATPNFDDVIAEQIQRGNSLPLSDSFSGANVAYLPTERDLGVILEIFSSMPDSEHEPDATQAGTPADHLADRSPLTGEHLAAYVGA